MNDVLKDFHAICSEEAVQLLATLLNDLPAVVKEAQHQISEAACLEKSRLPEPHQEKASLDDSLYQGYQDYLP